jgi:hypothetical protein
MSLYDPAELAGFLAALGYDEMPLAMIYSAERPAQGFHPKPLPLPTLEQEGRGEADLGAVWAGWSCVLGHIWLARKKHSLAWFDREHYGCLGGAFFLGYNKPQLENIVHYVSNGIPGVMEGERYFNSPEQARLYYQTLAPAPAPEPYCVFKPLDLLEPGEHPLLVNFFARPETISGLHQLTLFVSDDLEAVMSPWGAGCTNLVTWPLRYLAQGRSKAVLGGWDPSCRKFLKTDELTLTMPWGMFESMLAHWRDSFLTAEAWKTVRQKVARSRRAWGEEETGAEGGQPEGKK